MAEAGNQNRKVILLLVLFPPLGIVRIWTQSTWGTNKKILITIIVALYLLGAVLATAYPVWRVNRIIEVGYM